MVLSTRLRSVISLGMTCWTMALVAATSSTAPAITQGDRPLSLRFGGGWQVALDGHYRPRFVGDTLRRDFTDGGTRAVVSQRARLGLSVSHDAGWLLALRVQDVRVWGEELNTLNDFSAAGFDVHEAFGQIPIFDLMKLRLGRQEIILDNHRLVGNVGWTQRARAFDGARLMLGIGPVGGDLFYAKIKEADQDPDGTVPVGRLQDTDFGGARVEWRFIENHRLSLTYLLLGDYEADVVHHTGGGMLSGAFSGLAYSGEFYFQHSEIGNDDGNSQLAAIFLGYTLPIPGALQIAAFGDVLTGDGTAAGTFDTLFATNHKFYGEMDYFLNIPVHTRNHGLVDVGGKLQAKPVDLLTVGADFHHFRLFEEDADGDAVFGHELDVRAVVRIYEGVNLKAVYGVMFPGDAARDGGSGKLDTQHFAYVETNVLF